MDLTVIVREGVAWKMKEEIIVEKPQLDEKEEFDEHSKSILFLEVQRRNESYTIFGHTLRKELIKEVQFGVYIAE